MPFTKPETSFLIDAIQNFPTEYEKERTELDRNRWFANLRSPTKNPSREEAISFLAVFTKHQTEHQNIIGLLIPEFQVKGKKRLKEERDSFLNNALAGTLIWELKKIDAGYYWNSVKEASAFGKLLLKLFDVSKFNEIPQNELLIVLQAYQKYLLHTIDTEWGKDTAYVQSILDELTPDVESLTKKLSSQVAEPIASMAM